ncbi:MAG TPA: hypothetical protein VNA21_10930 [Steroidobacteraceae bacterium]|nr:hypothetical protein [Steroidobacteraceae bacterium]
MQEYRKALGVGVASLSLSAKHVEKRAASIAESVTGSAYVKWNSPAWSAAALEQ